LKLSDYDKKVVVLNIWATWCGPCKLEMPDLVKLNQEYKSRGLVVLGLTTTYNERNDQVHVKEFIKRQNIDYRILWDNGALAQPLVQIVGGRSVVPQSFVISRDGRIVKHFQGYNPLSTPALMRQAVEEALSDKAKA
jgi:peroxiredoxin